MHEFTKQQTSKFSRKFPITFFDLFTFKLYVSIKIYKQIYNVYITYVLEKKIKIIKNIGSLFYKQNQDSSLITNK